MYFVQGFAVCSDADGFLENDVFEWCTAFLAVAWPDAPAHVPRTALIEGANIDPMQRVSEISYQFVSRKQFGAEVPEGTFVRYYIGSDLYVKRPQISLCIGSKAYCTAYVKRLKADAVPQVDMLPPKLTLQIQTALEWDCLWIDSRSPFTIRTCKLLNEALGA